MEIGRGEYVLGDENADPGKAWREVGLTPPWERVYRDGVDVTDSPELWPVVPVSRSARQGRSRRS